MENIANEITLSSHFTKATMNDKFRRDLGGITVYGPKLTIKFRSINCPFAKIYIKKPNYTFTVPGSTIVHLKSIKFVARN